MSQPPGRSHSGRRLPGLLIRPDQLALRKNMPLHGRQQRVRRAAPSRSAGCCTAASAPRSASASPGRARPGRRRSAPAIVCPPAPPTSAAAARHRRPRRYNAPGSSPSPRRPAIPAPACRPARPRCGPHRRRGRARWRATRTRSFAVNGSSSRKLPAVIGARKRPPASRRSRRRLGPWARSPGLQRRRRRRILARLEQCRGRDAVVILGPARCTARLTWGASARTPRSDRRPPPAPRAGRCGPRPARPSRSRAARPRAPRHATAGMRCRRHRSRPGSAP